MWWANVSHTLTAKTYGKPWEFQQGSRLKHNLPETNTLYSKYPVIKNKTADSRTDLHHIKIYFGGVKRSCMVKRLHS